jgi:anaphase-promoting complex subunit 8
MHGDLRKEEEYFENSKQTDIDNHRQKDRNCSTNNAAWNLESILEPLYNAGLLNDLNCYLLGIAKRELEKYTEAVDIFTVALNKNPCLWSAWVELCKIVSSNDYIEVFEVLKKIQNHWMGNFHLACLLVEKLKIHQKYESLCFNVCNGLLCFFKKSTYIMNQIGHLFYHNQDYNLAQEFFEKILEIDPYRLENMDTYSNILYVREKKKELSALALQCFENNKYSPETCCVLGNYLSLMGEHTKAVSYFKKALLIDRNMLGGWTLIGHEYLE